MQSLNHIIYVPYHSHQDHFYSMRSWLRQKLEHWLLLQKLLLVCLHFLSSQKWAIIKVFTINKIIASFSSLCFSTGVFRLPTANMVLMYLRWAAQQSSIALSSRLFTKYASDLVSDVQDVSSFLIIFYIWDNFYTCASYENFINISWFFFLISILNYLKVYKILFWQCML